RARLRAVGGAQRGRRGGSRLPSVRSPRRTAVPARHRGLHAPDPPRRGARGGARVARDAAQRGERGVTTGEVPVLAVVVATRGGTRLEAALTSVEWASERAVLDPVGRVTPAQLPRGVRLGHDAGSLATLGSAAWLLLLGEHELATEAVAAACAAAVREGASARQIAVEVEMLGVSFVPRVRPVRLASREGSRLALDRTLELALRARSAPRRTLGAGLRATGGESVAAAVDTLEPEGRALAALLAQLGQHPRPLALAVDPLAAVLRTLRARPSGSAWLTRWVAAVLVGYRVTLAHAMLWEWRHAQPAAVRGVA